MKKEYVYVGIAVLLIGGLIWYNNQKTPNKTTNNYNYTS